MKRIIGLRSPHARVGRIVCFGRMLDKIRLHARGLLPPDYQANLGDDRPTQFDGRCCRFLGIGYAELRQRTLQGGCDEEILAWAHARGTPRADDECLAWNRFMTKIGWRDDRSDVLRERVVEFGLAPGSAQTMCELIDLDEERPAGATRSWEAPPVSAVIVMGVAGCGKTTVGRALSGALGWEFLDADDLHPAANVAKMAAGAPLDDADRSPWLAAVRSDIESRVARGARVVAACSALREAYRVAIAPDPANRRFAYLRGDFELLRARLAGRKGHYMKESMLRSQFEALEEPLDALTVDAGLPTDGIAGKIQGVLGLQ
jgi:carbohydrate kinase (thermoresistant glucokinase family)